MSDILTAMNGQRFLFHAKQMRCHPHATAGLSFKSPVHSYFFVASLTTFALEFYAVVWQPDTPMLRRRSVLIFGRLERCVCSVFASAIITLTFLVFDRRGTLRGGGVAITSLKRAGLSSALKSVKNSRGNHAACLPPGATPYARAVLPAFFFGDVLPYRPLSVDMKRLISSGVRITMSSERSKTKLCVSKSG